MLRQRVISSALGLPPIIALIWVGGAWFSVAVGLIVLAGTAELYETATRANGRAAGPGGVGMKRRPMWPLGLAFSPLLVAAAHFGGPWPAAALTVLIVLGLVAALSRDLIGAQPTRARAPTQWDGPSPAGLNDWLWTVGGVLYVGWLGSYLVLLRGLEEGRAWTLLAILSTFTADIAAYFTGRAWGRRKLAPSISPGKTIEGTLGGIVGAVAAAVALNYITGLRASWTIIAPLGLLLGIAAVAGDLVESMFKRAAGVKDAGVLIPGHGGVLDRLDSVLFVAAVVYYYARWIA